MSLRTRLFGSFDEPSWNLLGEAVAAYKVGKHAEAMSQFLWLSQQGSLISNVYIGRMYENGEGVEKNYHIALEWYYKSAQVDLPTAQFYLAELQRTLENYGDAIAWHKIAAEHGLVPSMFALYRIYSLGQGVEIDEVEAEKYLREASDAGHVFAQKHRASRMARGRYGLLRIPYGVAFSMYSLVRGMIKLAQQKEPDLIY